jgi:hypothetical protein
LENHWRIWKAVGESKKPLKKVRKPLKKAETVKESRKPIWVNQISCEENWILDERNLNIGERKLEISKRFSSIWQFLRIVFFYAIGSMFGSMCAHGFLIWKYSTHNLK